MAEDDAQDRAIYQTLNAADEVAAVLQTHLTQRSRRVRLLDVQTQDELARRQATIDTIDDLAALIDRG